MSQTAINLPLRFARAQPGVEGGVDEQGMSQGVEAVQTHKARRVRPRLGSRNGSTIGLKLAVADEPSQECDANLDAAVCGVLACRSAWRSTTRRRFRPVVGRAQAKCRPGGNLEGLGLPSQLDNGFGLQVSQFVEREPALEESGLRVPGVRRTEEPRLRVDQRQPRRARLRRWCRSQITFSPSSGVIVGRIFSDSALSANSSAPSCRETVLPCRHDRAASSSAYSLIFS